MPQVKMHVSSCIDEDIKERLAINVRKVIYEGLNIQEDKSQAIVYESEYRGIHYSRNRDFISVEIALYKGTSDEEKKRLAKLIVEKVEEISEIDRNEINIIYYEEPKNNFFYGGDI